MSPRFEMSSVSDNFIASRQISYLKPWFEDVSNVRMESLGVSGGLSGAVIWRVSRRDEQLCLRRWPKAHPTLQGLLAIHGLLRHVATAGIKVVPVPLPTRRGETYFVNEDHLWELTPWMPGEASFAREPNSVKLSAAVQTLAEFHQAAQGFDYEGEAACQTVSPGLGERFAMIQSLRHGGLERLWRAARAAEANDLREVACDLLEGIGRSLDAVASYLERIVEVPLPLQWCLRDVRHDHVLFTGETVSGLLDFGAVAVDSVAGDLARLLGSTVNDHAEGWRAGVEAYHQYRQLNGGRQLNEAERLAIVGFDEGGTICSAANWVRWLFVEGRSFPQIHALHAQLVWLRDRLQALAARSTASVSANFSGPSWGSVQEASSASGVPHRDGVSPWMHT